MAVSNVCLYTSICIHSSPVSKIKNARGDKRRALPDLYCCAASARDQGRGGEQNEALRACVPACACRPLPSRARRLAGQSRERGARRETVGEGGRAAPRGGEARGKMAGDHGGKPGAALLAAPSPRRPHLVYSR